MQKPEMNNLGCCGITAQWLDSLAYYESWADIFFFLSLFLVNGYSAIARMVRLDRQGLRARGGCVSMDGIFFYLFARVG